MSITHLKVEGVRSLADVAWSPGSLNVLIGPNGSGKSNLLAALTHLQTAASGKLDELVLRAGGIGALVWDSQARRIDWYAELSPDKELAKATYELAIKRVGSTAEYYVLAEEVLAGSSSLEHYRGTASVNGKAVKLSKAVDPRQPVISQLAHMDRQLAEIADRLRSIVVYRDIQVHPDAELRKAAVARREMTLSSHAQNLVPVLHTLYSTDRKFKSTVNNAMRAAFGSDFEELTFPPASDQRIDLRLRWRSLRTEQSAADLSDGTLRFLALVVILASPAKAEVIAIDEPELGLHPSMLPIIAELAGERSKRTQVILTTHSPQFLDAFGDLPQTTVCTIEGGKTQLTTISGDELAAWLERYSLGELFRSGELEAMA